MNTYPPGLFWGLKVATPSCMHQLLLENAANNPQTPVAPNNRGLCLAPLRVLCGLPLFWDLHGRIHPYLGQARPAQEEERRNQKWLPHRHVSLPIPWHWPN